MSVPFAHVHGGFSSFNLTAASKRDAGNHASLVDACRLSRARVVVVPSLYEGFGMPVIEAMASGCPVITTPHGSLAEAAGDAALFINGESPEEMRGALARILDPAVREDLRGRGLRQAARFRWPDMASVFAASVESLLDEARAGTYDAFLAEWKRLRQIQANVE